MDYNITLIINITIYSYKIQVWNFFYHLSVGIIVPIAAIQPRYKPLNCMVFEYF